MELSKTASDAIMCGTYGCAWMCKDVFGCVDVSGCMEHNNNVTHSAGSVVIGYTGCYRTFGDQRVWGARTGVSSENGLLV